MEVKAQEKVQNQQGIKKTKLHLISNNSEQSSFPNTRG